jgi:ABC-2 type transport system permease protein
MPIYEQTYRRYEARAPLRTTRFWPITREGLRLIYSKKAFIFLTLLCLLPLVVYVIQVFIVTRFPDASRILPLDASLFGRFLSGQIGPAMLLAVFAGAGLVANDLRTGAILAYLSRPLTRRDYIAGKLGIVLALTLSVTAVAGIFLYLVAVALAPDRFLTWQLWWLGPAVLLYGTVTALVFSLLILAISALARSARIAGLGAFGLVVALEIANGILRNVYDTQWTSILSITSNLRALGVALFGVDARRFEAMPWPLAAGALAVIGVASLLILRSRVRAVEIVK